MARLACLLVLPAFLVTAACGDDSGGGGSASSTTAGVGGQGVGGQGVGGQGVGGQGVGGQGAGGQGVGGQGVGGQGVGGQGVGGQGVGGQGVGGQGVGGQGGGPSGLVSLTVLDRGFSRMGSFDGDPRLDVSIRITNVSQDGLIGVGPSNFRLNQGGLVRAASDEPTSTPCDESLSLAVGGTHECVLAFHVAAVDGESAAGILQYEHVATGASAEVSMDPLPPTGQFARCQQFQNEACLFCVAEVCNSELEMWFSSGCGCPLGGASTGTSGSSIPCCEEMEYYTECAVSPSLRACIAQCEECGG